VELGNTFDVLNPHSLNCISSCVLL